MDTLTRYRTRADLTLDELVTACDEVLAEVAPTQTRYAVNDRPDVRTIRYYTTRGLLPPPLGYDGGRARYGGGHLARLVAIKQLQAAHLTLEQIRRTLAALDEPGVEALLSPVHAPSSSAAADPATAGDWVLELPGGRIAVTADVMTDAESRRRLADNLEQLARLLRATGGTDAWLVVQARGAVVARVTLTSEVVVGRSPSSGVTVDNRRLSDRHARFFLQRGEVWVEDLGTSRGSRRNDLRIVGPQRMAPGDVVLLAGCVTVKLETWVRAPLPPPPMSARMVDPATAERAAAHLVAGRRFVFCDDVRVLEPTGRIERLLGFRRRAGGRLVRAVVDRVDIGGIRFEPPHEDLVPSAIVAADRDLYRAEQDPVRLIVAKPSGGQARLVVTHNGAPFTEREVDTDPGRGLHVETLAMLLPGDYEASLMVSGASAGATTRFTVAEYRLAPLQGRLLHHANDRAASELTVTLGVESYGVTFNRPLLAMLVEGRRELTRVHLGLEAPGRYVGRVPIPPGDGPFRLRLVAEDDPARTAEVALPGSRTAERELTLVSELGREVSMSLLPEPGALAVRGMQLVKGDFVATPVVVDEIVAREPTLRATEDCVGLVLALLDVATATWRVVEVGDVERGRTFTVATTGPVTVACVGCFVGGQPFEGFSALFRAETPLVVEVPDTVAPRGELPITVRTGRSYPLPVLLAVRDERLTATDPPAIALGASVKRSVATVTTGLGADFRFRPVEQLLRRGTVPRSRGSLAATSGRTWSYDARSALDDSEETTAFLSHPGLGGAPRTSSTAAPVVRRRATHHDDLEAEDLFLDEGAEDDDLALGEGGTPPWRLEPPTGAVREAEPPRTLFPEVLFCALIQVSDGEVIRVPLADSLGGFAVDVFTVDRGDYGAARARVRIDQPVRADLDLAPEIHPEDRVSGTLRVACAGGRARVRLERDGLPVDLAGTDGGVVASGTTLAFRAGPGRWVAAVEDVATGVRDAMEQVVTEPGVYRTVVRQIVLLERGGRLTLDGDALSLRVLPGLDRPFAQLAEATAGYGHLCCEQTAAKVLSAVVMWMTTDAPANKALASDVVLAGIARERTMWKRGAGFTMYPGNGDISAFYTPKVVSYLWSLQGLAEGPDVPAGLAAAAREGLAMADDVAAGTGLQRVPDRPRSMEDAYALATRGQRPVEAVALVESLLDPSGRPRDAGHAVAVRCQLAYGAATLLLGKRFGAALPLANRVLAELNDQGRLYSTVDSVAAIALMTELERARIGRNARLRVNGQDLDAGQAAELSDSVEVIEVLDGVAAVEVTRLREERWAEARGAMPIRVGFRDSDDRPASRFSRGDRADLVVSLPQGYTDGDLVHVCLPPSMAWLEGGGRVKRFTRDFQGTTELRVPVVVTHPIDGKQRFAVAVRNMFEEERVSSPGLVTIDAA